jgi:hypothetical protein
MSDRISNEEKERMHERADRKIREKNQEQYDKNRANEERQERQRREILEKEKIRFDMNMATIRQHQAQERKEIQERQEVARKEHNDKVEAELRRIPNTPLKNKALRAERIGRPDLALSAGEMALKHFKTRQIPPAPNKREIGTQTEKPKRRSIGVQAKIKPVPTPKIKPVPTPKINERQIPPAPNKRELGTQTYNPSVIIRQKTLNKPTGPYRIPQGGGGGRPGGGVVEPKQGRIRTVDLKKPIPKTKTIKKKKAKKTKN